MLSTLCDLWEAAYIARMESGQSEPSAEERALEARWQEMNDAFLERHIAAQEVRSTSFFPYYFRFSPLAFFPLQNYVDPARLQQMQDEAVARWQHLEPGATWSFKFPWHDGTVTQGQIIEVYADSDVCDVLVQGEVFRFYCECMLQLVDTPPDEFEKPQYEQENVRWVPLRSPDQS